jgi:hypothetical protein
MKTGRGGKWAGALESLGLVLLVLAAARPLRAHFVTPEEVLARLNRADVKATTGIELTEQQANLDRHLIVKVNERWQELSPSRRRKLAAEWLALWRHAKRGGIVSVVDGRSGEPVVNYTASGEVLVLAPPGNKE